jgi:hypothetical protein
MSSFVEAEYFFQEESFLERRKTCNRNGAGVMVRW